MDVACQGRQMAVLFSVRCTGLVHLESVVGRVVCAESLLRWMEGPLKGTLSASTGRSEITSFLRSRRTFFSLSTISIWPGSLGFCFLVCLLMGLRTEKVWQFWGFSSLWLRYQRSYPMMAKMLKRLKGFPKSTQIHFLGQGGEWCDTRIFFKKRHPLKDFWKEGREEGLVGRDGTCFFLFKWTLKIFETVYYLQKIMKLVQSPHIPCTQFPYYY